MNIKNTKLVKRVFSAVTTVAVISAAILPASITIATPVQATGGLTITNVVDKDLANRGDELNYTVTVSNTGNQDTANTVVWVNELELSTLASGTSTYTRSATGVTKDLPDSFIQTGGNFGVIPAGETIVFKFKAVVAQNANNDDIIWFVAAADADGIAQVDAKSWTRVLLANPGICSSKYIDKDVVGIGETATFTIEFCNKGNVVLNDVLIFDRLDDRLDYVDGSTTLTLAGQTIDISDGWLDTHVNVGNVNPGQTGQLKFQVIVNDKAKDGEEIQNVAQLKSNETPEWIQCAVLFRVKGEKEVGHLKIFKYEDTNGNAVYNDGERALPGFKFTIKGNGFEKTVTTKADGVIVISNLKPGTYTITETVPVGWRITTDNNIKITIKADELTEVRFGNKQVGEVLGKVTKLPDTGPGLILALIGASIPAGFYLKRLKRLI